MIIHRRDQQGRPRDIELTDLEALVKEIHSNLMDRGYSQGDALVMLTAMDLPTTTEDTAPTLTSVLADIEFRAYLVE